VESSIIYANSRHGITADHETAALTVVNNTIVGNGGDGIDCSSSANCVIKNNIISDNGDFGIVCGPSPAPANFYNDLWDNSSGDYSGCSPGPGDISKDPLFADLAGHDYRLRGISACIDAGDPVERLTADYAAGGLVLAVDSVTAVSPGDTIFITDGLNTESNTVAAATATMVTLASGFFHDYLVADGAYLFTRSSDYTGEPEPNGARINMGAYGGTAEATLTGLCAGDFEPPDGDVDGSDLAVFAADFGRTDCGSGPTCEGDFDSDNDVDGSDLAVFAADFGRTDCP
jgi:parallel beta-helix repeat protein